MPPSSPFTPAAFQAETGATNAQMEALTAYGESLKEWQQTINLVGGATMPDLWHRHMLDSAQLLPLLPAPPSDRPGVLVDLGSGAGFPGLVLAALLPPGRWTVHLVESDGRKAAFLAEAARAMGLAEGQSVHVHHARLEAMAAFPADVVTARALAPLNSLLKMAFPFLAAGGVGLFSKGIKWQEELTKAEKRWKIAVNPIKSRTEGAARILRVTALSRRSGKDSTKGTNK